MKAVTEDEVREEFNRIAHVDSPTPDKRQEALRKQFSRKLIDAQNKALVAVHNDAAGHAGHALIWFVSEKISLRTPNPLPRGSPHVRKIRESFQREF